MNELCDFVLHTASYLFSLFLLLIFTFKAYGKWERGYFFPDITPVQGYVTLQLPGSAILSETDKMARS